MSSRGIAYRRWCAEQAKVRSRRIWEQWGWIGLDWTEEEIHGWVCRMAASGNKPCSRSWCCGNPRRSKGLHEPLTVQERRAFQDSLDELYEEWADSRYDWDWDDGWLWVPPHVHWWHDYQGTPGWKRELDFISRR